MKRETYKKLLSAAAYPLLLTAFVTAVWYIAAYVVGSEFIMPSPHATLKRFFAVLSERRFYEALGNTLTRALLAYAISVIGGLALAVLAALFKPLSRFLSPLVSVIRALPTMAVVLILVLWTGANGAPVFVTLMVVMPTLYAGFYDAITGVDEELVEACKVCGGSKKDIALYVYLPLAMPACSRSASSAISLSVKLTVAAEILASTASSLGYMMQLASVYIETAELMALTVLTVLVSLVSEKLLLFLLKTLWKKQ